MSPRAWSILKLALLLGFIAAAVAVFRFTPVGEQVTTERIQETIEGLDAVSARLAYIGLYIVGTVLLLPGMLLSFVGALLFGLFEATLYTWIGATIGATLAFLLAKTLGRDFVERLLRGRLALLDERLRRHGFTGLLVIRLVPLFPFNGVNFGCGLTGIRPRDYVLATAIGILPGTFVYQFLFSRLKETILTEGFSWSDLLDPVLGVALALFIALIVVDKWLAGRLSKEESR